MVEHNIETCELEASLRDAVETAIGPQTPPSLAEAMRFAVLGGGARLRPRLCAAVASACGREDAPGLSEVAAAIELLHCASLVHDDLPAFDDADLRRGRPTVHREFSEPLAILVGDALIAHAIALGCSASVDPLIQSRVVQELAHAVGSARGLVAGQAWESEDEVNISDYHQLKTGALFASAAYLGALVSGAEEPAAWRQVGLDIGEAYQIADDIRDLISNDSDKTAGRDALHDRPSALRAFGIREAMHQLHERIDRARTSAPACPEPQALEQWLHAASVRLKVADAPLPHSAPERTSHAPSTLTTLPASVAQAAG